MTLGEVVITGFIAFLSAGLGTLFRTRMNRLEERFSTVASSAELGGLRTELGELRTELGELRREVIEDIGELRREVREDIGSLRSDVTQVALAVGAHRPRASEG